MGNSARKGRVLQQAPEEQRSSATPFEATKNATQKAFQIHYKGKNVEAAIDKKDWKLAIQTLIDENSVVIFSDTTCKLCAKVKDLFNSVGVSYFVLELDQIAGKAAWTMGSTSSRWLTTTVEPQIYVAK